MHITTGNAGLTLVLVAAGALVVSAVLAMVVALRESDALEAEEQADQVPES